MLLGVPCIFLRKLFNSTLTDYMITEDNSIIADTVEEAIEKIEPLSWEQYESLCWQAKTTAEMQVSDEPRRK